MKQSFFKQRRTAAVFAITSFIGGFFFLRKSLTGNIILTDTPPTTILSLIGIALIFCSIILGAYSVRKTN